MYVDDFRKKTADETDHKISDFFSKEKNSAKKREEIVEEPEEKFIVQHSEDVLAHWRAPEFEVYERDKKWYTYTAIILIAIIGYAIFTNSPIMAITFILIGVVGYIYAKKEPRTLDFMITYDGIVTGREIYEYENIRSFWIFYEPEDIKVISLHTKSYLAPYVHIPIHGEDPVKIREILLDHIQEIKQEPGIADTVERLLRI